MTIMMGLKNKIIKSMVMIFAMLFFSLSYAQEVFNYDSAIQVAESSGDMSLMASLNYEKAKGTFRAGSPGKAIVPFLWSPANIY